MSSGLGACGALSAVAGPVVRVLTGERGGHASLGDDQRDELREVRRFVHRPLAGPESWLAQIGRGGCADVRAT
jgi:hypothetical protein